MVEDLGRTRPRSRSRSASLETSARSLSTDKLKRAHPPGEAQASGHRDDAKGDERGRDWRGDGGWTPTRRVALRLRRPLSDWP
jgi:hypothetical protein